MQFSNYFQTLLTAAEAYSALGWSVIPLLGDRDLTRPKVPALPWASFQQHYASLDEHHHWFAEAGFGGIGIVTGRISKLVVLDFDSEEVFKAFCRQYPDLTETRTIRSAGRQLPHLYFKLPDHLHIESQKRAGVDLLSNGRYVVAPPTSINGLVYRFDRGGMPKPLTERDLRRIQAFLTANKADTPTLVVQPHLRPSAITTESKPQQQKSGREDLERLYHHHCEKGGRNEALFRTCLYARDTGWHEQETQSCLVDLHSQQRGSSAHSKETVAQRQREALHTIKSAFSHPPRRYKSLKPINTNQLPNSVREVLMQRKMTCVIRVIEGLALGGFYGGQIFTTKQAEQTLKGLVGRDSIHNALRAAANPNSPFFMRVSPAHPLQTAKAVATSKNQKLNKKCFLLVKKNQEKPKGGRPQNCYKMPEIRDLCRLLGVKPSTSDVLERCDLASAPQTRMALHRELIRRRPGQYTRRWFAARLGVTMPTINAYNRLIPIHSQPVYRENIIQWTNIGRLPFDEALQGAFLVTTNGKKYPALRTIASMLLAKGEGLSIREQEGNTYWYGDEELVTVRLQIQQEIQSYQERLETFVANQPKVILTIPRKFTLQAPQSMVKQGGAIHAAQKNLQKPFADTRQETLANLIYTTINQISRGDGQKTISQITARRITLMQSETRVRAALEIIQQRNIPANPTGFLITILRQMSCS